MTDSSAGWRVMFHPTSKTVSRTRRSGVFSDFPSLAQHYSVTVTTWECKNNDELFNLAFRTHGINLLPNPRLCKIVFNTKPEYNTNICFESL